MQREHKRHIAPDGALALAYGGMCKIVDISKGGLSLMFLDFLDIDPQNELSLDLLSTDHFIKLRSLPGKLAWKQEVSFSSISGMVYKKIGVRFGKLSSEQKDKLGNLIMSYIAVQVKTQFKIHRIVFINCCAVQILRQSIKAQQCITT